MESKRWREIERVYHMARDQALDRRPSFLAEICGVDDELRREVESLLSQAEGAEEYLEAAALDVAAEARDLPEVPAELIGQVMLQGLTPGRAIGRYRLLQIIGEGGMGEVWLAEQKEPVRRRVALKLLKAGMNSREVIARFESERQALALMDHPTIAKVFDAGTTPEDAPYVVMEYIAGDSITTYCDNHRLSTRERLEVFMHVCEGVHHAHQKAIIHRDLKPSNILVVEVDGRAAPKIIDFGVAKALAQKLTANTIFTRLGVLVGTPEYMSPEQANSSGEDVDTRTDVYSLGVVLYQLLAGAPPLHLREVALDEFLRKLREQEPAKPSTRIRTHDHDTLMELASRRGTEPQTLAKQIRGDLDSIAMKAIEKDRSRRYGSASEFAADIGRYLNDEAVLAVPPSAAYRASKFARRYRGALAAIGASILVLILAAGVSIRQSIRANREAAVAQAVSDFLRNDLLAQASSDNQAGPNARPDPDLKVRTALDRAAARIAGKFEKLPEVEAAVRDTIGQTYIDLGLYPEARKQLERALDLERRVLGAENPRTLKTTSRLGRSAFLRGDDRQAEALYSQTLKIQRRVLGSEHPDTLESMNSLADVYWLQGKDAEAEPLLRQTLEIRRRVLGPEDRDTLASMNDLANVYSSLGNRAKAEALYRQILDIMPRALGSEHPYTLLARNNLAEVWFDLGRYAEAEALLTQTLEIERRVSGPDHPDTLEVAGNLADVYSAQGRYKEAEALYNQTLEIQNRVLGSDDADTLITLSSLAFMYQRQRKYPLAEACALKALGGLRHNAGSEDADTMGAAADLALAYQSQGKFSKSESLAREAGQFARKNQPDDWQRFRAESLLGASLAGQKNYSEAEPLLLNGYRGMLARKEKMAERYWYHIDLAREWIVRLYEAWGKPEKGAEWRKQ